jgi:hypothetical protein
MTTGSWSTIGVPTAFRAEVADLARKQDRSLVSVLRLAFADYRAKCAREALLTEVDRHER